MANFKSKDFIGIEYVNSFVATYKVRPDFDMQWEKEENMVALCSQLVVEFYG